MEGFDAAFDAAPPAGEADVPAAPADVADAAPAAEAVGATDAFSADDAAPAPAEDAPAAPEGGLESMFGEPAPAPAAPAGDGLDGFFSGEVPAADTDAPVPAADAGVADAPAAADAEVEEANALHEWIMANRDTLRAKVRATAQIWAHSLMCRALACAGRPMRVRARARVHFRGRTPVLASMGVLS